MSERRLRRFYSKSPLGKPGDSVFLTEEEARHLRRTLRLDIGDSCLVTDGRGREGKALVESFSEEGVTLTLEEVTQAACQVPGGLSLFVYPAFIQKGKMDDLVRQMQELAVQGFFPVETERTVVKIAADAEKKVLARWEKISQEASKQSGSNVRMQLAVPRPLKQCLEALPQGQIVLFDPHEESLRFNAWQKEIKTPDSLHLFFGPEGGFSAKEISLFESRKAKKIFLGDTILKADTAVLGVVSALRFIFL